MDHYRRILEETKDLDISLVIPNAGYYKTGRQDHLPVEVIEQMLDVNIYHVGAVTKLFYQRLLDRTLQKPGIHSGIVTVSSIASCHPVAFGAIYHATKAWVSYMNEGLQLEVQRADMPWSKMVDVMCLKPGITVSNMPPAHVRHLATPTDVVVRGAINNLGQYSETYGYWLHEF